jgi:AcrR family transcriptional regulator
MTPVNPQTPDRTYGGRSAAERIAERRTALIDATFDLIAQDGWNQLRIERICRTAGLNKRYFYESFADLDAISIAVLDRLAGDAIDATLAAMDLDQPIEVFVRAGISALVHHLTDDPRRARVLFAETPTGETAARHRTEAIHQLVATASAQGRRVHNLGDTRDPLIDLVGSLLVGGTIQATLDWLDGRLHDDIERFIDDLARLWIVTGDASAMSLLGRAAREQPAHQPT